MIWIQAIRPKTLIATLSPVLIGTFLFAQPSLFLFSITLLSALGIQISTNLANDYFDHLKGADTLKRLGPVRVTASGLVSPAIMQRALFLSFSLTALLTSLLILRGGLPLALLSLLSLLLALAYTTGPLPLAYLGLGDLFVLTFFGPIATAGTYYLQTLSLTPLAFLSGLGPGLLSTAILTVNNLRDIEEDTLSHKKTTVVRFGLTYGKLQYTLCLLLAALLPCLWRQFLPSLLLIPAIPCLHAVWSWQGKDLNRLLSWTALLLCVYTGLMMIS